MIKKLNKTTAIVVLHRLLMKILFLITFNGALSGLYVFLGGAYPWFCCGQ